MSQPRYTENWEERVETRLVKKPLGISRHIFVDILIRIGKILYATTETLTRE